MALPSPGLPAAPEWRALKTIWIASQFPPEEAGGAEGELIRMAEETTVFGRVTPQQKRRLIRALKAGGHTVAMVGDGVNDVLALKEADCSIAMAAGSDAANRSPSWCCWIPTSPSCRRLSGKDGASSTMWAVPPRCF